ncbi:MAG: hypothetical protein KF841_14315 [Phycisphaerae bacterium]|nr:hypothetical protein [Phycisphaerae bacterium]
MKGRARTKRDDADLLAMRDKGMRLHEIASALGRCISSVDARLNILGVQRRPYQPSPAPKTKMARCGHGRCEASVTIPESATKGDVPAMLEFLRKGGWTADPRDDVRPNRVWEILCPNHAAVVASGTNC